MEGVMENKFEYLDRNMESIRSRIKRAAERAGRKSDDIKLCVAIKSGEIEEINYLLEHQDIVYVGENRVQQMLSRRELLQLSLARVSFIGSLQTNKVKQVVGRVDLIESVDSLHLAREIDKQARACGKVMDILVEVNSGGEEQKGGVDFRDLYELCMELAKMNNIRLCGFMTMAPRCETEEEYRAYFSKTREAAYAVWERLGLGGSPVLSMGMTESFEAAILEGATQIRIGRGAFAK